jgi:hypothetical protein
MILWLVESAGGMALVVVALKLLYGRRCAVYHFHAWGSDRKVYIGNAFDPDARQDKHERESWWFSDVDPRTRTDTWYPSKWAAQRAEIDDIHRYEREVYGNTVGTRRHRRRRGQA